MKAWAITLQWLLLSLSGLGLMTSAARADTAPATAMSATQNLRDKCAKDFSSCLGVFEHYARTNVETNVNGKVSILSFFNNSDQIFSGYSQEIFYTEIELNGVEYQVGFGYIITAHQQDAKSSASGPLIGLQADVNTQLGYTTFTTSIIGLAPNSGKCAGTPAAMDLALLCSVNFHPTVNQDFFRATTTAVSTAFSNWQQFAWPTPNGKSAICPQIINYRSADATLSSRKIKLSTDQWKDAQAIQQQLQSICASAVSNAHIYYRNGLPKGVEAADIGLGGGTASTQFTAITQGYYRNQNYLSVTGATALYSPSDQYAEVYVGGVSRAAALPSLFAAVITLSGSRQDQKLAVRTQCAGGARAVSIKPLNLSGGDSAAQAQNFNLFLDNIRQATDGGGC